MRVGILANTARPRQGTLIVWKQIKALVWRRLPELRDAMSLVWRMLLLWMAALALLVIAGWVT